MTSRGSTSGTLVSDSINIFTCFQKRGRGGVCRMVYQLRFDLGQGRLQESENHREQIEILFYESICQRVGVKVLFKKCFRNNDYSTFPKSSRIYVKGI